MDAAQYLNPVILAAVAVLLALTALIVTINIARRQRKLLNRYRLLLAGDTERNVEQILLDQAAAVERLQAGLSHLTQRTDAAEQAARLHVQRSAIIRFNAFPDTGSDLSFAIALLDADHNGLVLSSLYGRHESRIYAKPITGGKSTYQLTEEEKQALSKAIGEAVR